MWLLLLLDIAMAQNEYLLQFDGHGPGLVAVSGDRHDYFYVWRPQHYEEDDFNLGLTAEYAENPLRRGDVFREPAAYVDDVFGTVLTATVPMANVMNIGVTAPLWLTSEDRYGRHGPTAGAVRTSLDIALARRPPSEKWLAGFRPWIDWPAGSKERYLTNRYLDMGWCAGLGRIYDKYSVAFNAEFRVNQLTQYDEERGPEFPMRVGVSRDLPEVYSVHLEGQLRWASRPDVRPFSEMPAEVLASVHGTYETGAFWRGGVATSVQRGPTAADVRLFAGGGYRFGARTYRPFGP